MVKIELLNHKKPRVTGLFVVICVEVLVLRKIVFYFIKISINHLLLIYFLIVF